MEIKKYIAIASAHIVLRIRNLMEFGHERVIVGGHIVQKSIPGRFFFRFVPRIYADVVQQK